VLALHVKSVGFSNKACASRRKVDCRTGFCCFSSRRKWLEMGSNKSKLHSCQN